MLAFRSGLHKGVCRRSWRVCLLFSPSALVTVKQKASLFYDTRTNRKITALIFSKRRLGNGVGIAGRTKASGSLGYSYHKLDWTLVCIFSFCCIFFFFLFERFSTSDNFSYFYGRKIKKKKQQQPITLGIYLKRTIHPPCNVYVIFAFQLSSVTSHPTVIFFFWLFIFVTSFETRNFLTFSEYYGLLKGVT